MTEPCPHTTGLSTKSDTHDQPKSNGTPEVQIFSCNKCHYKTPTLRYLRDHTRKSCKGYSKYICERCDAGYNLERAWKDHWKKCLASSIQTSSSSSTRPQHPQALPDSSSPQILLETAHGDAIHAFSTALYDYDNETRKEPKLLCGFNPNLTEGAPTTLAAKAPSSPQVQEDAGSESQDVATPMRISGNPRKRAKLDQSKRNASTQSRYRSSSPFSATPSSESESPEEPDVKWEPSVRKVRKHDDL